MHDFFILQYEYVICINFSNPLARHKWMFQSVSNKFLNCIQNRQAVMIILKTLT